MGIFFLSDLALAVFPKSSRAILFILQCEVYHIFTHGAQYISYLYVYHTLYHYHIKIQHMSPPCTDVRLEYIFYTMMSAIQCIGRDSLPTQGKVPFTNEETASCRHVLGIVKRRYTIKGKDSSISDLAWKLNLLFLKKEYVTQYNKRYILPTSEKSWDFCIVYLPHKPSGR